ncbi:MAG: amino acid racemase [Clostridia bacterium]|nr:amino acid racemase [Clostridia bacterium]
MNKQTIGIIGGMGPMATADLFTKIINLTDAKKDAEHIHILIDNNPQIPDRTSAILHGTESPLPYLIQSAERLADAGADFLIIPCITSHGFYDELVANVKIPVLNIVEETAKHLVSNSVSKAVLLATDGTRHTNVFGNIFEKFGIELLYPSDEVQADLMDMIYNGVKAGADKWDSTSVNRELSRLKSEGAETVILGCTELPLAAKLYGINGDLVDPTTVLAKSAIIKAGYSIK